MLDVLLHKKSFYSYKTVRNTIFQILIIEDDYVNFLILEEMLSEIGISCQRVNTITDATLLCKFDSHFDAIIIGEKESCPIYKETVCFLHRKYKAPILVLMDREENEQYPHAEYEWIDGIILNNYDPDYFKELIEDILSQKICT